jgi:hypothetical protein
MRKIYLNWDLATASNISFGLMSLMHLLLPLYTPIIEELQSVESTLDYTDSTLYNSFRNIYKEP